MYFLLVGLVVLNLFTLKGNVRGGDKIYSIKFLMIRVLLPLVTYSLISFGLQTTMGAILGVIGIINTMIDVRYQQSRSKEDEKVSYYNKIIAELNSYVIIIYTLLLSFGAML